MPLSREAAKPRTFWFKKAIKNSTKSDSVLDAIQCCGTGWHPVGPNRTREPKELLLVFENGQVQRWDLEQKSITGDTQFEIGDLLYADYDGKGTPFALVVEQQSLAVWDLATNKPVFSFPANVLGPGSQVPSIAAVFRGHVRQVNHVTPIEDGRRMASASDDGNIRVWDLRPEWRKLVKVTNQIVPRRSSSRAVLQRAFLLPVPTRNLVLIDSVDLF